MELIALRDVRRRKLFTLRSLAERTGLSTKTIVDIEHGRQTPRLETIDRIATALQVDPLEVVEFVEAIEGKAVA